MFCHEHYLQLFAVGTCIIGQVQGFVIHGELLAPTASILILVTITISIILIALLCMDSGKNSNESYANRPYSPESQGRRGSAGAVSIMSYNEIGMADRIVPTNPYDKYSFPRQNLTIGRCIGNGQYGQVFLATAVGLRGGGHWDAKQFAIKTVKDNARRKDKLDFLKELELMKKMKPHKNVLQLLGCCIEREPFYLIVEYMPKGNLKKFLDKNRKMLLQQTLNGNRRANVVSQRQLWDIARQVADGMAFLSSNQFIHGDLATRNVLLGPNLVCKVSDFGRARHGSYIGESCGKKKLMGPNPIRWMAVESLVDDIHTPISDVWSYGVLLWEITTLGGRPYGGMSPAAVILFIQRGNRLLKPQHCSPELLRMSRNTLRIRLGDAPVGKWYEIMMACWNTNPSKRPTFTQISETISRLLTGRTASIDEAIERIDRRYDDSALNLGPVFEQLYI